MTPRTAALRRTPHVLPALLATLLVLAVTALLPTQPAAASTERVQPFGSARALGDPPATRERPLAGIVPTSSGAGYHVTAADGGVFSFGDAPFHGSLGGTTLAEPIVGIAPVRAGRGGDTGYRLVAADGGVFTFGDATFHGSLGHLRLNAPVVGMAPTPSGRGYLLAAADGGVFTFGDATFHGSLGHLRLNAPIVALAATPSGRGYLLAAADGGVFTFGDATFHGSLGDRHLNAPIVALAATPSGRGYLLAAADGGVFTFGDAAFHGSSPTGGGDNPVVALAAVPVAAGSTSSPPGYWLLRSPPRNPPPPPASGTGRRVVYSITEQRVWLVATHGMVERSWPVSGHPSMPSPGTYRVFSQSRWTRSGSGSASMEYMTRFAHGPTLAIGFHSIPTDSRGRPLQSEAELGQYRSAGCVRMAREAAAELYHWAPVGTTVVVTR